MKRHTLSGMTRRHFLNHVAVGGATTLGATQFLAHLEANAAEVQRNRKACILIWLGGGAPTIDMWDLKPNSKNGGEFKPISTRGDLQISEHLPKVAQQMDSLSVVRSMATREADHMRGTYYMHTAYVPNPTVVHPTFGSVVSYELGTKRPDLEIPAFVSIGGGSMSPGFLGMTHAPFVVDSRGNIRNANMEGMDRNRLGQRLEVLSAIEDGFIRSNRGDVGQAHKEVYEKAVNLMTSSQMQAFRAEMEDPATLDAYGGTPFGNSLVMARRLVETGVPFIEVRNTNGWDLHQNVFATLRDTNLPTLDSGIAGLVQDLKDRGMFEDTVVVCMGEFGRTPRINANVGRDHWATSWSVMIGGGGLQGGLAVGATDADGIRIESESYQPGDLWATVAHALRIPLNTVHTSKRGRPMKLANGGNPIKPLLT
ncbi:MAG: DUF1501 domain-containing protein [Planctomycetota bacterium]|nr:MAG: DUF1501 domain-containing protein [Planctomycetota bacterium]REJ95555.1 MAG: DUF1501 domain-containing protein [Planctomycetota bacterium]REK21941.1 MAG: DUF1501 domain-containing protein [Planctomycetota bacterium]REK32147.1 MAG: DUF1501 domain-containing protein [Planctomycetota bacterium]